MFSRPLHHKLIARTINTNSALFNSNRGIAAKIPNNSTSIRHNPPFDTNSIYTNTNIQRTLNINTINNNLKLFSSMSRSFHSTSKLTPIYSDNNTVTNDNKTNKTNNNNVTTNTVDSTITNSTNNTTNPEISSFRRFYQSYTAPRPAYPRYSYNWWREILIVFIVFGVTGSSSLYVVKPLIKSVFGVDGSLVQGPWSYRLLYIPIGIPAYSMMLVTFGTLAGRQHYFKKVAMRMWGRFIPKKYMDKITGNTTNIKKV